MGVQGMATEALESFEGASSSPSSPSKKSEFSMHGLKSMFKKTFRAQQRPYEGYVNRKIDTSAYFCPGGGLQFEGHPLPFSKLGSSWLNVSIVPRLPRRNALGLGALRRVC